jgi:hypothetical protein
MQSHRKIKETDRERKLWAEVRMYAARAHTHRERERDYLISINESKVEGVLFSLSDERLQSLHRGAEAKRYAPIHACSRISRNAYSFS